MTTLQTPYRITAVLLHVYQVGAAVPPGLAQLHVTSSDPLLSAMQCSIFDWERSMADHSQDTGDGSC